VRHFLTSPWRGKEAQVDQAPFYAAAFSASNARIVVRDWIETTLESAQSHLKHYFQLQHMAVLSRDKKGAYFRLDEQLQEILSHFDEKKFPPTLDLMAQGRFALGFYQQRAANRQAVRLAVQKKAAQQQAEASIEETSSMSSGTDKE
jgi:hypothetical protein